MTTLVGTQKNFSDAVYALIELDYDAVEAYKAAVKGLENTEYKASLANFQADHERHITELSAALRLHHKEVPTGPDSKALLTKGKVVLADLIGDKAILMAMLTNEMDTNTAYERVSTHAEVTPEFEVLVQKGLADERRHKAWIELALKA